MFQVGLEGSVNPDHEKELKQEQETWEKKTGILTYLVDKEGEATFRLCTIWSVSSVNIRGVVTDEMGEWSICIYYKHSLSS